MRHINRLTCTVLLFVIFLALTGCITSESSLKGNEVRYKFISTRIYYADYDAVFSAARDAIEDKKYIIGFMNRNEGYISAEKSSGDRRYRAGVKIFKKGDLSFVRVNVTEEHNENVHVDAYAGQKEYWYSRLHSEEDINDEAIILDYLSDKFAPQKRTYKANRVAVYEAAKEVVSDTKGELSDWSEVDKLKPTSLDFYEYYQFHPKDKKNKSFKIKAERYVRFKQTGDATEVISNVSIYIESNFTEYALIDTLFMQLHDELREEFLDKLSEKLEKKQTTGNVGDVKETVK